MFPAFVQQDVANVFTRNVKTLRYFALKKPCLSKLAYLSYVCFGEFCSTIYSALCRFSFTILITVLRIFRGCCPFKVVGSIVSWIGVFVINVFPVVFVRNKSFGYQTVNRKSKGRSLVEEDNSAISKSSFKRFKYAVWERVNTRSVSTYTSKIRDRIKVLKAFDWNRLPNFFFLGMFFGGHYEPPHQVLMSKAERGCHPAQPVKLVAYSLNSTQKDFEYVQLGAP